MIHQFKLSFFHSARVRLVVALHQEVPAALLHPVIPIGWGDSHCFTAYLELTALVVFDETRHYHLTLFAQ